MTGNRMLTRIAVDYAPALVVTGALAVAVSRAVAELATRLPLVAAGGLCGIALAEAVGVTLRRSVQEGPVLERAPRIEQAAPVLAPPVEFSPERTRGFDAFTLAKIGSTPEENEDAFAIDETRMTIAVSDGASSSFGASIWSRLLADGVARAGDVRPAVVDAIVSDAAAEWVARHQSVEVAWWAREGLERGAFATLLAVAIDNEQTNSWTALAVGDSCVLHLRQDGNAWTLLSSFPVGSAEDFDSHPELVSSVGGMLSPRETGGRLRAGDVLIAATDAVAEWLLGSNDRLRLAADGPLDIIRESVVAARIDRTMVNDDATFVRFRAS